jgi:hypothetical protein
MKHVKFHENMAKALGETKYREDYEAFIKRLGTPAETAEDRQRDYLNRLIDADPEQALLRQFISQARRQNAERALASGSSTAKKCILSSVLDEVAYEEGRKLYRKNYLGYTARLLTGQASQADRHRRLVSELIQHKPEDFRRLQYIEEAKYNLMKVLLK